MSLNPLNFTFREMEVIELISKGYTNYNIAHNLGLAYSTIRTNLNNIYDKMIPPPYDHMKGTTLWRRNVLLAWAKGEGKELLKKFRTDEFKYVRKDHKK